jgi:hypothetical protein
MASNAQGKVSASDFTGKQREALAEKNAAELAVRAEEISTTLAAEKAAASTEVLDVTKKPEVPVVVDEIQVVDDEDGVVIRVNEDLQQVTIGRETYDFISGRKYKVPRNVAFVLEERGRIWH